MLECMKEECRYHGKNSFADIYHREGMILIKWHPDEPMCEHIWEEAKAHIDFGLKQTKGELPPEEMLRSFCPYCHTRIPKSSETSPNCRRDVSKFQTPNHKAALAKLEKIYGLIKRDEAGG